MPRKEKPGPCRCAKLDKPRPRPRKSPAAAQAVGWRRRLRPYLPALPALVSELRSTAVQLEDAVLQACDGFHGIGAAARAALGGASGALEKEIVRVVVALQFQDIVNQRIVHAIEMLTELEGELGACLAPARRGRAPRPDPFYAAAFARGAAPAASQTDSQGEIEIFLPEVGS